MARFYFGLHLYNPQRLALTPGARLGPYEIVSALGAGGMGEVYRARDPRLSREVAIKVLPGGLSSDPERLQRFEQEARAAAALNHPNILALYDIGTHDGAPYLVTELLEGATLREQMASVALPIRKAIEYAVQIAHGLAAAHEKGIVHRDLKPENVFVTDDGRVKILDFGLAKLTQPESSAAGATALPTTPPNTMAGVVLGTIGYMSPEQVRGMAADHRADIFAFGAVLYEMLSGQRAFHGDTAMDAMTAIVKDHPPDLPAVERRIPPALVRIVDRCLEKSPAARFQSTRDLAFALESLTTHSGATSVVAAIEGPSAISALWRRRAAMAWASAAGVLLLVAVALAIGYVSRAPVVPRVVRFSIDEPKDVAFGGGNGFAPGAAISPDGRSVAFMARRTGGSADLLWIRSLDTLDARPLTGTDGGSFPFWSPDSTSIAFFAQGKLKKIDVSGGPAQTLCDALAGEGGTWNRDGVIVFAPNGTGALFRVSSAGGEPVAVTKLSATDKDTSHRWPDFLPDGRHFLFRSQPSNVAFVGSLDSGEVKRLVTTDSRTVYAPGYLIFVRGGTLVAQPFDPRRLETTGEAAPLAEDIRVNPSNGRAAFAVSESGVLAFRTGNANAPVQLTWFDRAGRELAKVGQLKDYRGMDLSPDGQRIVLHLHDAASGGGSLWMLDPARGTESRFTFTGLHDGSPHWSPDGSRVVFSSDRSGEFGNLYVKQAGGATPEEALLKSDAAKGPRSWSADGRFIVYDSDGGKTASDIWVLPLTGDRTPIPFLTTPAIEGQGELSPDGRWMAYTSNESGRFDIYVQPFPATGGKWLVSTGGGIEPHWRRDGKELFYVSGAPRRLMAVEVKTQGATFEASVPHALFDVAGFPGVAAGPNARSREFVASADGQKFLVALQPTGQASNPLTIVLNWTAGLKK
jgi:Tol biopolymer transport system component